MFLTLRQGFLKIIWIFQTGLRLHGPGPLNITFGSDMPLIAPSDPYHQNLISSIF